MMMMENPNFIPTNNINNNSNNLTAFIPVIFFDGERDTNLGNIEITPLMTFKTFQSILSHKINISPHQITTYFERNNNYPTQKFNHNNRRRHPVTNKFDFPSLVLDYKTGVVSTGSHFWVVLKRSRRTRRRRPKNDDVSAGCGNDNFVLLRRDMDDWVVLDYVNRMRMMQLEKERDLERYFMSLNLNSNVYSDLSGMNYNNSRNYGGMSVLSFSTSDDGASSSTGGAGSDKVFCDVCYNCSSSSSGGSDASATVPFHWCKNDVVTMGFRSSPAGPIAPPSKNSKLLG